MFCLCVFAPKSVKKAVIGKPFFQPIKAIKTPAITISANWLKCLPYPRVSYSPRAVYKKACHPTRAAGFIALKPTIKA